MNDRSPSFLISLIIIIFVITGLITGIALGGNGTTTAPALLLPCIPISPRVRYLAVFKLFINRFVHLPFFFLFLIRHPSVPLLLFTRAVLKYNIYIPHPSVVNDPFTALLPVTRWILSRPSTLVFLYIPHPPVVNDRP